jgi:arginine/lysine/ornithine decarboxylase
MDPEFRDFLGPNALSIDLIGIEPLDDLHQPQGAILAAEQLAAAAFGADHCFFSVQGTTGAILTMILATCRPGEKIILPRNAHKSILSALILSGAEPVFLTPELDQDRGIMHGISSAALKQALNQHPDTKAVLVINPTYYGSCSDLSSIVETVHTYKIPVLVDEAHGVLNYFSPLMPCSAMAAGADLAATSVHKLGGSLTQSSVLNLQGKLVNKDQVRNILSMITTTSTSYLLLASLDTARRYLALQGEFLIARMLKLARKTRTQINQIEALKCHGPEIINGSSIFDLDESKLLINLEQTSILGNAAEKWLRNQANIEVELSDLHNLLCFLTLGDNSETTAKLIQGLKSLAKQFSVSTSLRASHVSHTLPALPKLALNPRQAFYASKRSCPLKQASSQISAEFVTIYPPGIPVLIPGEVLTEENISYIEECQRAGLLVYGTQDPTVQRMHVVK